MYVALRADIERLMGSIDNLTHECSVNTRRCGELQRDLDLLRRALRAV